MLTEYRGNISQSFVQEFALLNILEKFNSNFKNLSAL